MRTHERAQIRHRRDDSCDKRDTPDGDNKVMPRTPATTVRRLPDRARYNLADIHAILDAGFVCHVAFNTEFGPTAIPTLYARDGDRILLHGSSICGMAKGLVVEQRICVTVTLLDGLVLARSAFHHSANYRSAMLFGKASLIENDEDKLRTLDTLIDRLTPGRAANVRPPNRQELKATAVLSLPIDEASAKIRTGGPKDDPEDKDYPVWAGTIPLRLTADEPIADGIPLAKLEAGVLERIRATHAGG